ncbi:hypothetical protein [Streptomyces sp. NPDC098781]|uniref:hypothetical protein n=1 Tax=Streptomyces sp. NPDC098781 TaxID=3366097 RepID=UPI003802F105
MGVFWGAPAMWECSATTSNPGLEWRVPTHSGSFRHIQMNRCLDTNGTKLYMSTCSSADRGQQWDIHGGGVPDLHAKNLQYGSWLTRFNDGTLGLLKEVRSSEENFRKSWWFYTP